MDYGAGHSRKWWRKDLSRHAHHIPLGANGKHIPPGSGVLSAALAHDSRRQDSGTGLVSIKDGVPNTEYKTLLGCKHELRSPEKQT